MLLLPSGELQGLGSMMAMADKGRSTEQSKRTDAPVGVCMRSTGRACMHAMQLSSTACRRYGVAAFFCMFLLYADLNVPWLCCCCSCLVLRSWYYPVIQGWQCDSSISRVAS